MTVFRPSGKEFHHLFNLKNNQSSPLEKVPLDTFTINSLTTNNKWNERHHILKCIEFDIPRPLYQTVLETFLSANSVPGFL